MRDVDPDSSVFIDEAGANFDGCPHAWILRGREYATGLR
jgi:hypothetical protein